VVSDISQRLIQLHGDLVECAALEKMQGQSTALVFRQGVEKFLEGRICDQRTEWIVVLPACGARAGEQKPSFQIADDPLTGFVYGHKAHGRYRI